MWENKRVTLNGKPVGEKTGILLKSIRDVLAEAGAEDLLAPATLKQPAEPATAATPSAHQEKLEAAQRPAPPGLQVPNVQPRRPVKSEPGVQPRRPAKPEPSTAKLKAALRPVGDPRESRSLAGRLFGI
ncbi:hypothetical protein [Sagittula salina]|uniref:Uncharacterized protein n=1 Tax=Sagittula salina TaxID=2820268 RepID=A0A940S0W2_9RHOB|nr:hypothetical protein [Sagittula salina]MBP0482432.1 hypothetical protein [Sagittula salina]